MMHDDILDTNVSDSVGLNEEIKGYLYETAKWGRFLAIVGFVMVGFMVIVALFAGSFMSMMGGEAFAMMGGAFITVLYLAMAAIYFMPCLYLYRFSTKTKTALDLGSSMDLTEAFGNLKSVYKFWGILTAVMLGLYALAIVISIIATVAS